MKVSTRGDCLGEGFFGAISPAQIFNELRDDILRGNMTIANSCIQTRNIWIPQRCGD